MKNLYSKGAVCAVGLLPLISCPAPVSAPTSTDPEAYSMNGFIQKGPIYWGSAITIQEPDKNFDPTGASYSVQTNWRLQFVFYWQQSEVAVCRNPALSHSIFGPLAMLCQLIEPLFGNGQTEPHHRQPRQFTQNLLEAPQFSSNTIDFAPSTMYSNNQWVHSCQKKLQ